MAELTRRTLLRLLGGAAALRARIYSSCQTRLVTGSTVDSALESTGPLPTSFRNFGLKDGKFLDDQSFYSVPTTLSQIDRLCFDTSNNRLAASFNHRGLLERVCLDLGVAPNEIKTAPVGAYVDKVLLRGGPYPLEVRIGDAPPIQLDSLPEPNVFLEGGIIPRFEWRLDGSKLLMRALTPQRDAERPRAVILIFSRVNEASRPMPVSVNWASVPAAQNVGTPTVVAVRWSGMWSGPNNATPADLSTQSTAIALIFEGDQHTAAATVQAVTALPPSAWLQQTKQVNAARYGELSISEAPAYAELLTRSLELSRQSLMLDTDSNFGGSFNGSDLPPSSNIWMRDCFYSVLSQTYFHPELSRKAILFFLRWGVPSRPLGEHADRFPGASGITNSLGNSVAGVVLAGLHFARNGDRDFFHQHPEILHTSQALLEQVLASRREEVFLFPSIYVSDGEARGDYHTGSNIFVWHAFTSFARIADEVYGNKIQANLWRVHASRLQQAILENCIVVGSQGPRYVEGVMQDQTKVLGHDGEESDVNLAPLYGFCRPDDVAYLNAAAAAITPENPYAFPDWEGIWWFAHGKWSSVTFPGWMTALASSRDQASLLSHLEHIRAVTDADGSFWWWPYPHTIARQLRQPLRSSSKCGWAAGVYSSIFVSQVLGLGFDASAQTLTFQPFLPWNSFEWKSCRLGKAFFDCSYLVQKQLVRMTIRNLSAELLTVILEPLIPVGMSVIACAKDGRSYSFTKTKRYSQEAANTTLTIPPGKNTTVDFSTGAKAE